jgi:hypothetical protein
MVFIPLHKTLIFFGVYTLAPIVKIQEYTNNYATLQYKCFTIKTFGLRHVSCLSCVTSSGSVYRYLFET